MKRNFAMKTLTIGLLTVSAFALAACQEDGEAQSFQNVEQCISASKMVEAKFTEKDCRDGFAAATAENKLSAPRYDAMQLCEEEHGAGNCVGEQRSDGSSVFMPMMMGYMMGSWMNSDNDRDRYRHSYVPMYPIKGGGYSTSTGYYSSSFGNKSYASPSALSSKPAATFKSAPMTRVSVASRGGFGGGKTGGFGG
jgi:uncharacterized protein YgiB involved in biofilm formation